MGDVYEICPICHNDRSGKFACRDSCQGCGGDGFVATGLTAAQVEAHAAQARRLQYVKALGLSLLPPPRRDKSIGWLCTGSLSPSQPPAKFRGDTPEQAIDAAINGVGLS